ncbi:MAG TPA: anthranilate synthase component I family protein [Egibacteraceae bacterium]|nr:anthranilate synthase component I family protein [Egibacteraceae bacterium]
MRQVVAERLDGGVDPLSLCELPGQRSPAVVTVGGWKVAVADPLSVVTDPKRLDEVAERAGWREDPAPHLPPFQGGAVGHLSDDISPGYLSLPRNDPRPACAPVPAIRLGLYDSAVCVSPDGSTTWLVAATLPGLSRADASERLAAMRAQVAAARAASPALAPAPAAEQVEARLSMPPERHSAAVARIHEWIAAGDLYQLNLTLQVIAPWAGRGTDLARALWAASPGAAHAAYLKLTDGVEAVSVSPETFLRIEGRSIATRPIKGTRPRAADPAEDEAAGQALVASAKDQAEHVMIVDLERNDLGRVCEIGSISVAELAALERHPTVWHLTSTVRGTLREDAGLGEVIAATFPSGSVTGTPKRTAVARTTLVEPLRRGIYCGAIGVITRGMVDLSVAIRTAVVHQGRAFYGTGGGIVADSEPEAELAEAIDKARAFLAATGTVL